MIRVIYNWLVDVEKQDLFTETWKSTTNKIHKTVHGAQGSFMLKNTENPKEIKTIARWDSIEDWRAFWQNNTPSQMQALHKLGQRISVETYEEIDDYTH